MDLLRVAKSALDVKNPFDEETSNTFLDKAALEFNSNLPQETILKNELGTYKLQINLIKDDPLKRIRWGEKVMTIASRLGTL